MAGILGTSGAGGNARGKSCTRPEGWDEDWVEDKDKIKVMLHSISVDVEEYFHAANLQHAAPPAAWHRLPQRVVSSTERTLEIFAKHNVRATFFILGYIAQRHPALIRRIFDAGHEIASHGYSHRLAFSQTPKQFLRDVKRSKALLENITGSRVLGYRAPNFSIQKENSWAYDALLEAGYIYDSSLYPTWHPRYNNSRQTVDNFLLTRSSNVSAGTGKLFIFPLAVLKIPGGLRLPAAGGAYWRLLPQSYCASVLRAIDRMNGRAFHCYFHPWELDADQPVFTSLSMANTFRHYAGAKSFEHRLEYFLKTFSFSSVREVGLQIFGNEFAAALVGK